MGETFGPQGPEQPGWDWFWEQFRRHRSPPMRPRRVPPVDDGEKLRRARIRKAALELARALAPGDESLERADYAGALLGVQEMIDDLDLCVTCRRNEWECACGADAEEHDPGPDDGFGMDRVVLTALDHAGIALPTFWNGEPAECRRVRVVVGPPPIDGWWSAPLTGQVRDAVEVTAEDGTFYIDDQDGTGWAHVTVRQGDPLDPRPTLPVKRVIGIREPEPRAAEPAAEADVYAALAVRSGVPVERVRQFFEGATPEQVKRLIEPPEAASASGREPIPLHRRKPPPAPMPAREPAAPSPAPARRGRRERIRAACRDLIDVYHEPRAGATDRELLDEAAKVIERERNALQED
jgi:hypothetical protein